MQGHVDAKLGEQMHKDKRLKILFDRLFLFPDWAESEVRPVLPELGSVAPRTE